MSCEFWWYYVYVYSDTLRMSIYIYSDTISGYYTYIYIYMYTYVLTLYVCQIYSVCIHIFCHFTYVHIHVFCLHSYFSIHTFWHPTSAYSTYILPSCVCLHAYILTLYVWFTLQRIPGENGFEGNYCSKFRSLRNLF